MFWVGAAFGFFAGIFGCWAAATACAAWLLI